MKVLIGTKNPAKIEGAKKAFDEYFDDIEIVGIDVKSEVSEEPVNDEIYEGAKNRVNNLIKYAKENNIYPNYYLGIESGMTNKFGKWMIINIAVIKDKDNNESFGTSASFPIPDKYVNEIMQTDLGKVMDRIFMEQDLRIKKGGINFLTHGKISRIDLTKEAFVMALTQYVNGDIWKD